tara:strand:+ start:726 stop:1421 length:696 start_codon:yes stop_codon:yes gene_type:complete
MFKLKEGISPEDFSRQADELFRYYFSIHGDGKEYCTEDIKKSMRKAYTLALQGKWEECLEIVEEEDPYGLSPGDFPVEIISGHWEMLREITIPGEFGGPSTVVIHRRCECCGHMLDPILLNEITDAPTLVSPKHPHTLDCFLGDWAFPRDGRGKINIICDQCYEEIAGIEKEFYDVRQEISDRYENWYGDRFVQSDSMEGPIFDNYWEELKKARESASAQLPKPWYFRRKA